MSANLVFTEITWLLEVGTDMNVMVPHQKLQSPFGRAVPLVNADPHQGSGLDRIPHMHLQRFFILDYAKVYSHPG